MVEQAVVNSPIQQPPIKPLTPKPNYWIIAIIILVIIFIVGGVYALALQSQKQIPVPVPLPLDTSVKKEDRIANWKTYTNNQLNIDFKYPNEWEVVSDTSNVGIKIRGIVIRPVKNAGPIHIAAHSFTGGDTDMYIKDYYYPYSQDVESVTKKPLSHPLYKVTEYKIKWEKDIPKYGAGTTISLTLVENGNQKFVFENYVSSEYPLLQILSTFKFLDQEQTVCTQDAKLCPDGSYVSRQGPNCEFAACP